MPSCGCPSSALTSLTFDRGIVLQRCMAHEAQTWVVDGAATDRAHALDGLRTLFVERGAEPTPKRGTRAETPVPRPRAVAPHPLRRSTGRPARATAQAATAGAELATLDGRLTALLRSRGISGSWSVA